MQKPKNKVIKSVMDMEMIHLRIATLPTFHILGAYPDSSPTVDHTAHVQARLDGGQSRTDQGLGRGVSVNRGFKSACGQTHRATKDKVDASWV